MSGKSPKKTRHLQGQGQPSVARAYFPSKLNVKYIAFPGCSPSLHHALEVDCISHPIDLGFGHVIRPGQWDLSMCYGYRLKVCLCSWVFIPLTLPLRKNKLCEAYFSQKKREGGKEEGRERGKGWGRESEKQVEPN